jgi:CheY-like chemotaxis protein
MHPCVILYAEDEADDVFFLGRAFELAGLLHTLTAVPDGEQAIEYLAGGGVFSDRAQCPLPNLVLLDINMPKQSGLDVLAWLRGEPHLKSLPALIFTSSSRPEDLEKARQLGADDYLLKPSNPRNLVELVRALDERWLSRLAMTSSH